MSKIRDGVEADRTALDPNPEFSRSGRSDTSSDTDAVFEVLSNRRRRQVIRYLYTEEQRTDIGSLAEYVAGLENGVAVAQLTSAQRKRAYVGLYQCHLPKMDEYDIIRYDRDRGTVAPGPRIEDAAVYITDPSSDETPTTDGWPLVVGSIVTGLLTFAVLSTSQLVASLGPLVVATGIAGGAFVGGTRLLNRFEHARSD